MKTKLIIGIVLAVIGLVAIQYFFLTAWYRELEIRTSGWLMMLSVAMGIALSVWLLDYVIQNLLDGKPFNLLGLSTTARTGSKVGAYLTSVVSYPFALFLGFIVGGSLGGSVGEMITHPLGLGSSGVVVGISLGVFVVTTLTGAVAVLVGFVLGGFTEKIVKELRT
jgi:uncharacterized protein (DUF486 family)